VKKVEGRAQGDPPQNVDFAIQIISGFFAYLRIIAYNGKPSANPSIMFGHFGLPLLGGLVLGLIGPGLTKNLLANG
jgi:hypothetical protein